MSEAQIKAYWNELNAMYGTETEMPEGLIDDATNFNMNDVKYEMAMGKTFDDAMQSSMNF